MDFEVRRLMKRCAVTDQELRPGAVYYSALVQEGGEIHRHDFCAEAWQGPPERTIAWWSGHVPSHDAQRTNWAPQDVMIHLFEELADQTENADLRYLLTLLMVRRRIFRVLRTEQRDGREYLVVHSAKLADEASVEVVEPNEERKRVIRDSLQQLIVDRAA